MLTVIPTSGLCNRMRAVDSAIAFGRANRLKVDILWIRDSDLNCPFSKLFKPIKLDGINFKDFPALPYRYRVLHNDRHPLYWFFKKIMFDKIILRWECKKLVEENFDFNSLKNYKRVLLSSFSRFYPNESMYKLFQPIDELQERINKRAEKFGKLTIGVHIRRADHIQSINNSPTELFVEAMKKEIEFNPAVNFYLASDSEKVKHDIEKEFNGRIITVYNETDRNTISGNQEALVDLFSLSRTSKIYGSYYSSFSHTAAHLSGIEEITVQILGNVS